VNWLAFVNATSLALETIRAHKMRAFLTVLGIVIGTGTIIGVGAILTGFNSKVTAVLESFGPNSVIVFKFSAGFRTTDLSYEERTRRDINYQNALDIREKCNACAQVSPILITDGSARYKGNDMYNLNVLGVDETYIDEGQVDMNQGRFFTADENRRRLPVAVLGADLVKGLYSELSPVGKTISVNGQEFQVIGTMKKPAASMLGPDDLRVVLPFFTLKKHYPETHDLGIVINAKPGLMPQALDQIRSTLRIDRRVPYSKPDDFALSTAEEMVSDFRQITSMVALVMIVLSSVGLLVGGIGVMNIMLVSVTERTKEIGVRKAIGARRFDIVLQFLIEAVVLTGIGGLMGVVFGWTISFLSRLIFPSLPSSVPLWAAVLGLFVSAGTGLFFGIWPANKAAGLDPVEALRYE
jgi:putative ABC transport system permease protein